MNSIELYKKSIIDFTKKNELNEINYLIGIIFLSKMNKYCKENNIIYHGYYITDNFINLYSIINNYIIKKKHINPIIFIEFYNKLTENIKYMDERINNNIIKDKIKNNLFKFIQIINPFFKKMINFSNNDNLNFKEIIDEILIPFFYILLITSKFMGSGIIEKNPNLLKISEYYSNIFYTHMTLNNNLNIHKQEIFNNYTDNKIKLHEAYININFNSNTITDILLYIDNIIIKEFSK